MKRVFLNQRIQRVLFFALFVIASVGAMAQEIIRVTGTVTDEKKIPLPGVAVLDDTGTRMLALTDDDGKYAVNVMNNGVLNFKYLGFEKQSVKVKNKTVHDIVMKTEDRNLGEVGVKAKRIIKQVAVEPTSIEVIGNFFHVRTRVPVPNALFNSNSRLVVQPIITDVTKNTNSNMRPLVFDGKEYNLTQQRMYDYDITQDPLHKFIIVKSDSVRDHKSKVKRDILPYHDSIYVPNVKHEFLCDVFVAIENYQHIVYGDTMTIAKGTVNPLRFLQYNFGSKEITDSAYFPRAEMQLRDGAGQINFVFPIGESTIDMTNENNKNELQKLEDQLLSVENNNDSQLRDFSILGVSSPDGIYANNLSLAQSRMKYSLNLILSRLSAETRNRLKVSSKAEVAGWNDLTKIMRADSLYEIADEIDELWSRYSRDEKLFNAKIKSRPYYKTLKETYLPKLRKSDYTFKYTVYRQLTIKEIEELYKKDYKQLSRYEFWKLYNSKSEIKDREYVIRQALQVYPGFMMAANDLAVILINRNEPNDSVLERFAGEKAPQEVNLNQIVALLEAGRYSKADSISEFVVDNRDSKLMKSIVGALNGKFADNYEAVASTGQQNKVLILLAMKQNEEALKEVASLPDSVAMTHYLRAISNNRLDNVGEAYDCLQKALEMDPSLKRTARMDGDVNDLLPKEDEEEEN